MVRYKAEVFAPVAARDAPRRDQGILAGLRRQLFGNWFSTLTTLVLIAVLLQTLPDFIACNGCDGVGHPGIANRFRVELSAKWLGI
ncbi:MAG: hypothetical protein EBV49_11500 [Betaproteobacteria bacterium]|nr:hypothetical protein [Betaproteobacteria bacterium]